MGSGALLALVIFASGFALLVFWLARTYANPRYAILLGKSALFFLLPGALMVALPIPLLSFSSFALLLLSAVLVEEILKMTAARSETLVGDKFALAALFGIYELMLAKPLQLFHEPFMPTVVTDWDIVVLLLRGTLPVLMHTVTAALYATTFAHRPVFGLVICFGIHAVYNFLVLLFPNIAMVALLGIVLATILALNWPGDEQEWDWEQEPDPEPAPALSEAVAEPA